jgi:hypothetical protein
LHNILPHKPWSSISGIVTRLPAKMLLPGRLSALVSPFQTEWSSGKLDRNCVLTKFQIASVYEQNRNKCSTLCGRQQNTRLPSTGTRRCISCCPLVRQVCTMRHITVTVFILFGQLIAQIDFQCFTWMFRSELPPSFVALREEKKDSIRAKS